MSDRAAARNTLSKRVVVAVCALLTLIAQIGHAAAQGAISSESALAADDPASQLSRDKWKAHVNEIKKRVQDSAAVNPARSSRRLQPTASEISREAMERVLRDYSLVPGDVVMTDRGPLVFRGRSGEEPRGTDFEKLTEDAMNLRKQQVR